ncbi:VIT domain-containing protein [Akkermansiaceae bacterium]|nr:VIT domain-containing protein [Akkermansiaceae bacterium]
MKRGTPLFISLISIAVGSEKSPYFEIGGDHEIDCFPLKSSHSAVTITGSIADITLTQIYTNDGNKTIDATYLFPASSGAAVHGMMMKIGDRTIKAEIQEKKKARQAFEEAKNQKKSASLLTQKLPNLFSMEMATILPGDQLTLTLNYSEILKPNSGDYEFVIPTAIGPRYRERGTPPNSIEKHFLNEGRQTRTRFSVNVNLSSPLPIQKLTCPSHEQSTITFKSKTSASLDLNEADPDRDFMIRYQLSEQKILSGLLSHKGSEENTFLIQLEPPREIKPQDIPERDFIFVIDVSGSMKGFPLNLAKDLFRELAQELRPEDQFNILLFAGANKVLSGKSLQATDANVDRAINFLNSSDGTGGTRLLNALEEALELPHDHDHSRSLILISDGYIEAETEVFDLIKNKARGTNIFPLGVGSSVNRHLLEGLSHFTGRDHFIVTHSSESDTAVTRFKNIISTPVLTNIQITSEGVALSDLLPARQPDLFYGQTLSLVGKWQGSGAIFMTGTTGNGERITQRFEIQNSSIHPSLPTLWARIKVKELSDFAQLTDRDTEKKQVTEIGLKYQLLTPFTSFVAITEEIRETEGKSMLVKQAKPLPLGVSNSAKVKGNGSPNDIPEPSSGLLILLVGALTLSFRIRN